MQPSIHPKLLEARKLASKKTAQAVKTYEEYLQEQPEDMIAQLEYADCLATLKQIEKATIVTNSVIMLEPTNTTALLFFAIMLQHQGKYIESQIEVEKAKSINPQIPNAYIISAYNSIYQGDLALAVRNLEQAYALANNDSFLIERIASGYSRAGKFNKAFEYFLEAFILKPTWVLGTRIIDYGFLIIPMWSKWAWILLVGLAVLFLRSPIVLAVALLTIGYVLRLGFLEAISRKSLLFMLLIVVVYTPIVYAILYFQVFR